MDLCPYFGKCGGCSSQNISYEQQLENKKIVVARHTGVDINTIKVFSDKPFYYRNRMDLIFHPRGLGLREKGNWKSVVDIEQCMISNEKLNLLLKEVRDYFKNIDVFDVRRKLGTYRYAVIRTPSNSSSISFVLNEDSMKTGEAIDKIKSYAKTSSADSIIVTYVPKDTDSSISEEFFVVKGSDMINENFLGKSFEYSTQGFFQNNTAMAEKMHEYVNGLISAHENKQTKDMNLLDLYAGVGTFGINNAHLFKHVFIVESDKHCIDSAKVNIEKNNVKNAEATLIDATSLKKLQLPENPFVITDPPRSGMHPKTIDELNRLKPKHIIYISCNAEQLGRELKKFPNHKLLSVAMFDLFPQTPHVETIVELERLS
jgi:23S rRNA (uracil-5-)-methyltransferase RumA